MYVLGTAGHVDHGKSSLLRALTFQEPDRLPEEKRRGMTLDLNFVWLEKESGERIGIVDVPGHQRFVKNMISGVMSVDAFLFVVAADDGWMPQSEEHLAVLKSLGVSRGIGIVTKTDLVTEERVSRISEELGQRLETAFGESIPVLRFSTLDSGTADSVRMAILTLVGELPRPVDFGKARLWVDRVFVPKGLGVVVTGTLREGVLQVGDEVGLAPSGKTATVKGLQVYQRPTPEAHPVARVAVQLSRIEPGDIERGTLLYRGEGACVTKAADARIQFFESIKGRNVELSLHVGTAHSRALVIRLSECAGGMLARLKLRGPLPLRVGDRFLLRTPGEERTLGCGIVMDPVPVKSHRSAREALESWGEDAVGFLRYSLKKQAMICLVELSRISRYRHEELLAATRGLDLVGVGETKLVERSRMERAQREVREALEALQRAGKGHAVPSEISVSDPELRLFAIEALLVKRDIEKFGRGYRRLLAGTGMSPMERMKLDALMQLLEPGTPLSLRELETAIRGVKDTAWRMVKEGRVVALADQHFIHRERYEALKIKVHELLKTKGQASTSELRVFLNSSRKNVVLILEQMDRDRVTYLKDNVRRLLRG